MSLRWVLLVKFCFWLNKNPYDLERVPGGSSSGSAAAVADDQAIYALGSDTGGSIRQPSSFCGIVGLKTTYGRVSRYGLIAHASSLDQIGPMTKTVEDARIVFDIIKGKDVKDSTSMDSQNDESQIKIEDLKIGIPKEYLLKELILMLRKSLKKRLINMRKWELIL